MEDANGYAPGPQPQHHVAQLADSRISQDPLNIGHHQTHSSGKNSGNTTDDGYRGQCLCRVRKEGEHTGDQEDASGYHSGGMD